MLPPRTLARRLREDAIGAFSINADMIVIGGIALPNPFVVTGDPQVHECDGSQRRQQRQPSRSAKVSCRSRSDELLQEQLRTMTQDRDAQELFSYVRDLGPETCRADYKIWQSDRAGARALVVV